VDYFIYPYIGMLRLLSEKWDGDATQWAEDGLRGNI
jgi:hypothetical protein